MKTVKFYIHLTTWYLGRSLWLYSIVDKNDLIFNTMYRWVYLHDLNNNGVREGFTFAFSFSGEVIWVYVMDLMPLFIKVTGCMSLIFCCFGHYRNSCFPFILCSIGHYILNSLYVLYFVLYWALHIKQFVCP